MVEIEEHTPRKEKDDITRKALEWNPLGHRRRGMSKQSRMGTVVKDREGIGWT